MSKQTFALAAVGFSELVARLPTDGWEGPGLGEWDLRALVGHASRALVTVETYLEQPADHEQLSTPEAYFVAAVSPGSGGDPTAVAERGRQAGAALGEDPRRFVGELTERVLSRVQGVEDPVIATLLGGMRLSAYLPTRTFELVVHSADIAASAGVQPVMFPIEVLSEVAALSARIAVGRGRGHELIQALTGRTPLAPGFSVV